MAEEFVLYHKFTDTAVAEDIAAELKEHGIDCHLQNNLHSYLTVVGAASIDFAIGLNLRPQDFPRADAILDYYCLQAVREIDKGYYLFEFTDAELREIINNPYDWGQFDYQLAKHILKEKGEEVSDTHVQQMKQKKISDLSQQEKVNPIKLVAGYILALIIPVAAIVIGITILYNRTVLPNGEKFYIHSKKERMHGKRMITISMVWMVIIFLWNFYKAD